MTRWPLQDAKAHFSEVVEKARRDGPQMVTKHGRDAVVIMAADHFRMLSRLEGKGNLVSFFRHAPLSELAPEWLERDRDAGREVPL